MAIGINRSATKSETISVLIIDTPICLPRSLIRKLEENTKGRKTVMDVRVAAIIGLCTSIVPCTTDSSLDRPFENKR